MSYRIEKIENGSVTSPLGYRAAGVACGIKKSGVLDLALLVSDRPCSAAGVFTTNQLKGASLLVSRENIRDGKAQAIVVNSGNANASTGERGLADARAVAQDVAQRLGVSPEDVLPSSTGVIGEFLPLDKMKKGVEQAAAKLRADGGVEMAQAIMTTDTFAKHTARRVEVKDRVLTLGGICKGAGMIHPNMATMLCYITTDAAIDSTSLLRFLREAVSRSFNRLSIDGDTSCCDTVILLANGAADVPAFAYDDSDFAVAFGQALEEVCMELVKILAKDGEGVTTVVTLRIDGAPTQAEAQQIGKTIATSPLVKTAFHGQDPNWGRIINAAGYSGVTFDPGVVDLWIGPVQVMKGGMRAEYREEDAHRIMTQAEYEIRLNLNQGDGCDFYITTDFSKEYVDINADYRNRT